MEKNLLENFGIELIYKNSIDLNQISRESVLNLVKEYKLVVVRGVKESDKESFLKFLSKNPKKDLIHWSFGPVMELKVDPNTENYLFSNEAVPFHWDGAFHEEPHILAFQCLVAPDPSMGGETIFVIRKQF